MGRNFHLTWGSVTSRSSCVTRTETAGGETNAVLSSARVLLVDDDKAFVRMVARYLDADGFRTSVAHRGDDALNRLRGGGFDVMVLDIMMPGLSGQDVLRRLCSDAAGRPRVPVVLLSAKGDEVDRVIGLEAGADDYLAKPCALRELAARLRAVLRRSVQSDLTADLRRVLRFDTLTLDTGSRHVRIRERQVQVTDTEFSILRLLMEHGGSLVTRNELAEFALGRSYTPCDRSLDVHIANLRHKLGGEAAGCSPIRTIRGRGYLLAAASRA